MHKRLGGDTTGIVGPDWPKRYSVPYGICSGIKAGGKEVVGVEERH